MNYDPKSFWDQRLQEHFDLRGTGETGLSLAYNRACYELRRRVLTRALRETAFDPRGARVLDVGCGTGFFTAYYLERGANVTGLDIAPTSIERLSQRFPQARFVLSDVSEAALPERYDLVNAFDVLYHITDDARWERAVTHLAKAVAPGGVLLVTDTFADLARLASHNTMRPLGRYRELGPFRPLNRLPRLLYALDRALLALGLGHDPVVSKLLVARRTR